MEEVVMRGLVVVIACLFLAVGAAASGAEFSYPSSPGTGGGEGVRYAKNKILLQLTPRAHAMVNRVLFPQGKTGIEGIDQVGERRGAARIRATLSGVATAAGRAYPAAMEGWHTVIFGREVDVPDVVREYRATPGVVTAQPVHLYPILREPNDSLFVDGSQWHLQAGKVDGPGAWEVERGSDQVIVAVIDTGVRYYHKDLGGPDASYLDAGPGAVGGNIWTNPAEAAGSPGVDDDGNGYVDDWVGYDFVDGASPCDDPLPWPYDLLYAPEDCSGPDNDPRDYQGHGTHCAGNVAAINNNIDYDSPLSVASIAGGWWDEPTGNFEPGSRVMVLRAGWSASLGLAGYVSEDHAAEAFLYAADNGARIASCSWGGVSENDELLRQAVQYFLDSGGLVFKAAGNGSSVIPDNMSGRWSAAGGLGVHAANLLNVAATDQSDCKAGFSDYGGWVDVAAPGVNVWSTHHAFFEPENDKVYAMDGTSMAAPIAAGVAALVWSQNPGWTAEQVRLRLLESAEPFPESCGYPGQLGAGRVQAARAVAAENPGSQPPVAVADSMTVIEGGTVSVLDSGAVSVLANDTDAEGDPLSAVLVTDVASGALTLNGDGTFSYTHDGSNEYVDAFSYRANDGFADGNVVTVSINITPAVASDEVKIVTAEYKDKSKQLSVEATSSAQPEAMLTLSFGSYNKIMTYSAVDAVYAYRGKVSKPTELAVTSSLGGSDSVSLDRAAPPPPAVTSIVVGSLVAASEDVNSRFWSAAVTVGVVDGEGAPVSEVTVNGIWDVGYQGACVTDAAGACTVASRNIKKVDDGITFTLYSLTHATLGENSDPDASITVSRP